MVVEENAPNRIVILPRSVSKVLVVVQIVAIPAKENLMGVEEPVQRLNVPFLEFVIQEPVVHRIVPVLVEEILMAVEEHVLK